MLKPALFLIIIGSLFDTTGDLMMRQWISSNSTFHFIFGLAFYLVGLIFLAFSFNFKNMVVASVLFLVCNMIVLSLANWLIFGETLNTKEFLAVAMGFVSVFLFEMN